MSKYVEICRNRIAIISVYEKDVGKMVSVNPHCHAGTDLGHVIDAEKSLIAVFLRPSCYASLSSS